MNSSVILLSSGDVVDNGRHHGRSFLCAFYIVDLCAFICRVSLIFLDIINSCLFSVRALLCCLDIRQHCRHSVRIILIILDVVYQCGHVFRAVLITDNVAHKCVLVIRLLLKPFDIIHYNIFFSITQFIKGIGSHSKWNNFFIIHVVQCFLCAVYRLNCVICCIQFCPHLFRQFIITVNNVL